MDVLLSWAGVATFLVMSPLLHTVGDEDTKIQSLSDKLPKQSLKCGVGRNLGIVNTDIPLKCLLNISNIGLSSLPLASSQQELWNKDEIKVQIKQQYAGPPLLPNIVASHRVLLQ